MGDGSTPDRIRLLARARGGSGGTEVGSTSAEPYVIQWFTPGVPNLAEIELVAVAERGGAVAESAPTWVRTQNAGVPKVELVTAFTVPPQAAPDPDPAVRSEVRSLPGPQLDGVLPPAGIDVPQASADARADLAALATNPDLAPQQTPLEYILEWQWSSFAGADGYGVYLSTGDLAGPYELQIRQAATAGGGAQKHSRAIPSAGPGSSHHGVVTAVTGGATAETGFSDADATTSPAASSNALGFRR